MKNESILHTLRDSTRSRLASLEDRPVPTNLISIVELAWRMTQEEGKQVDGGFGLGRLYGRLAGNQPAMWQARVGTSDLGLEFVEIGMDPEHACLQVLRKVDAFIVRTEQPPVMRRSPRRARRT